eukprot:1353820-Pyramimonas_sp.AAC.1
MGGDGTLRAHDRAARSVGHTEGGHVRTLRGGTLWGGGGRLRAHDRARSAGHAEGRRTLRATRWIMDNVEGRNLD